MKVEGMTRGKRNCTVFREYLITIWIAPDDQPFIVTEGERVRQITVTASEAADYVMAIKRILRICLTTSKTADYVMAIKRICCRCSTTSKTADYVMAIKRILRICCRCGK
ncbi:unnamed protein product [Rhizophagus irregularis]|nr:unnamed protein product [Rhizophagus irregularis]